MDKSAEVMEQVRCNLCQGEKERFLFEVVGHVCQAGQSKLRIVQCEKCGLVYVNPRYKGSKLIEKFDRPLGEEGVKIHEDTRVSYFKRYLFLLEKYKRGKGRLLDIGCSTGAFMAMAHRRGWQVQGVEMSRAYSDHVRQKLGFEVFTGPLEEAPFEPASFDVITFWEVLEHLPDPHGFLRRVHLLLRKDGLIGLSVPNFLWFISDEKGNRLSQLKPHYHLYQFTQKTLKAMIIKSDFRPLSLFSERAFLGPEELKKVGITVGIRTRAFVNNPLVLPLMLPLRRLMGLFSPGNKLTLFARKK